MHFKGKVRKATFNSLAVYAVLSWLIVMALLVFFLSSGRPAWGHEIHVATVFEGGADPVPYQDWDTSKSLDGWHILLPYQWALGVYLAHEEMERRAMLKEIVDNPPDKTFFYAVSAFFLVIAAGVMYADKLFALVKRKLS